MLLFAIPDEETRSNRFEIGIPNMASIILEHSPSGIVPGLNDYYAEDGTPLHPPVGKVFWSFRVMVGTGMLMLALSWFSGWFLSRRDAVTGERWHIDRLPRIALYGFVAMTFMFVFASIPMMEKRSLARRPNYQSIIESTSMLLLLPPKS